MFERMLNKEIKPTYEEMQAICRDNKERFTIINDFLVNDKGTQTEIVFPYGNNYGWSVSHKIKKKLICNVFPENGSFTVMIRLDNNKWDKVYNVVCDYTKKYIDTKYPCSNGGWIHYRVLDDNSLSDIMEIISLK